MSSSDIITALIGLVLALIAAFRKQLLELIPVLFDWFKAKLKDPNSHTKLWEKMRVIYGLVDKLKHDTSAARVVVLCNHNGGLEPKTGSPNYLSVLPYAPFENAVGPLNFKKVEVDIDLVDALLELAKSKSLTFNAEETSGVLRDICLSNSINYSMLVELKAVNEGAYYYFFLWLQFSEEVEDENKLASMRLAAHSAGSEIADLLESPKAVR